MRASRSRGDDCRLVLARQVGRQQRVGGEVQDAEILQVGFLHVRHREGRSQQLVGRAGARRWRRRPPAPAWRKAGSAGRRTRRHCHDSWRWVIGCLRLRQADRLEVAEGRTRAGWRRRCPRSCAGQRSWRPPAHKPSVVCRTSHGASGEVVRVGPGPVGSSAKGSASSGPEGATTSSCTLAILPAKGANVAP